MCQNCRSCRKQLSRRRIFSNGVCLVDFASMYTHIRSINSKGNTELPITFQSFEICAMIETQPPNFLSVTVRGTCYIASIKSPFVSFYSRSKFIICLHWILFHPFSENWVLQSEQRMLQPVAIGRAIHTYSCWTPKPLISVTSGTGFYWNMEG